MNEYISKDDVLLHSEIIRVYSKDYGNIDVVPVEYLADIPAADVQPVRHGRWIEVTPKHSRCSVCDTTCLIAVYPISKGANYCPNCGARMDGDTECQ